MGADRTLIQVKVRCGLGRVGVLGRLYGNSRGMSANGVRTRKAPCEHIFSALPPKADVASLDQSAFAVLAASCRASFEVDELNEQTRHQWWLAPA